MIKFDIVNSRLANQVLSGDSAKTPGEVVKHLGGIQAQDYSGGEWSIGLRLPGTTLSDIDRAIADRKIIRTWAMRGTLHFLAGSDVDWILDLLAPGIIAGLARRYDELELDTATFRKTNSILAKSLSGNKQLTRNELKTIVEKNGICCAGQRMTFILHHASLDKIICFGVTRGKQETHTLLDEWVHAKKPMMREEALAELARRYFTGHGPATIQDYMWWSGLRAPDANVGLEAIKSEFERISVGDKTSWTPRQNSPARPKVPVVHLLPPFDNFLLGYRDRSDSIDPAVFKQLRTGGIPDATIMIDGKIAGKWKRTFKKESVVMETKRFRKFNNREEQALEEAVKRFGEFMGKRQENGAMRLLRHAPAQ